MSLENILRKNIDRRESFKAGIKGLVLLTGCATATPTRKDSVEIDFKKSERWHE